MISQAHLLALLPWAVWFGIRLEISTAPQETELLRAYAALGCGTVFKLDQSGAVTVLYSFTGGADGNSPRGNLVLDAAGNIYGTTLAGGTGFGTVFKLDPSVKEKVLYSFTGGADGAGPGGLAIDVAGNLYGTAFSGGTTVGTWCQSRGCGTVFKMNKSGTETTLYSFIGQSRDGMSPWGYLVLTQPATCTEPHCLTAHLERS